MTIRAFIVDDEPLARRSVRRFLRNHIEVAVISEYADGASAAAAIFDQKPDLVFLDVQMPEMDGFDVVRQIGVDQMPALIFVTAYDQYAIQAFDANAIDYLLKPFGRERFDRALARAKKHIHENLGHENAARLLAVLDASNKHQFPGRLPVTENGRIIFVKTRDIDWIEASGNYARLHIGSHSREVRESLMSLERKLDPRDFVRIHRSTIVNMHRIKEIQPWFHGYHLVVLENGKELRMSRYQREVAKIFGLASHPSPPVRLE